MSGAWCDEDDTCLLLGKWRKVGNVRSCVGTHDGEKLPILSIYIFLNLIN